MVLWPFGREEHLWQRVMTTKYGVEGVAAGFQNQLEGLMGVAYGKVL